MPAKVYETLDEYYPSEKWSTCAVPVAGRVALSAAKTKTKVFFSESNNHRISRVSFITTISIDSHSVRFLIREKYIDVRAWILNGIKETRNLWCLNENFEKVFMNRASILNPGDGRYAIQWET